jgi:transposase
MSDGPDSSKDRFDHMDDHTLDPKDGDIRRIEVITGTGRRRRWTTEAKARIVAESFSGNAPASEIARRHGIRPQQLFGWRREARTGHLAPAGEGVPSFAPIVTDVLGHNVPLASAAVGCAIEIEIAGMIVRVRGRVAAGALVEVLTAVRRAR